MINLVTASRDEAEILLRHPDIKGVSFVGSTKVGKHIYATAAANGKRVQALTEAKNHALVLGDCKLERTARGIINAYCGCAGARCMACPVVVVEDCIADELIALLKKFVGELNLGPAYDPETGLGPIMNEGHLKFVTDWIQKGVDEGAELIVDGRNPVVPGYENGFFLAPSIFDHVTEEMSIGHDEIFGPVLCIKRVKDFEEGLAIMNASPFANGSVIYTQNGYYAREFSKRTDAGWWVLMWVSLFRWGSLDSPATKILFSVISMLWGWTESAFLRSRKTSLLRGFPKILKFAGRWIRGTEPSLPCLKILNNHAKIRHPCQSYRLKNFMEGVFDGC